MTRLACPPGLNGLGFLDEFGAVSDFDSMLDWGAATDFGDASIYDWSTTLPDTSFDWTADASAYGDLGFSSDFDFGAYDWGFSPDVASSSGLDFGNGSAYGDVNAGANIPTAETTDAGTINFGSPQVSAGSSFPVSASAMPDLSSFDLNDVMGLVKQGFTLYQAYENLQQRQRAGTYMPSNARPYVPGQPVPAGYRVQTSRDPVTGQTRSYLVPNTTTRYNPNTGRYETVRASGLAGLNPTTIAIIGAIGVAAIVFLMDPKTMRKGKR